MSDKIRERDEFEAWCVADLVWSGDKDAAWMGWQARAALAEPAQPTHVEFWLIERGPNQGQLPHVWGIESANGIHDWTETAIEATRYPTKAAAGKAASWESHGSYVITSHSIIGAQPAAQPLSDEQINRIARQYMSRMTRPFYTKWKDGIDVEYPVIEIEQFARAIERAITAKDAP